MNAWRILHEAGAADNPAFPPGNLGKRQSRRRSPMQPGATCPAAAALAGLLWNG
jgi:hypothetical protein